MIVPKLGRTDVVERLLSKQYFHRGPAPILEKEVVVDAVNVFPFDADLNG